ncbi:MAG: hypothetical protein JSS94_02945 [Bacteroidetes bacterium]|nr:hypothetical protein [Bacteroidota bacterium]
MRKIFSLFLLLSISLVFAQKTISGVVKNTDGDLVSSASITVEEKGKDAIIAYAITNAKGEFKINFTTTEPSVDVKVKAFNHKTMIKNISNENQTVNFSLQTEATEIKEVKLKAKMITAKGDTISYDLKAFENKSDRSLADVLKKMPGFEVKDDGTILHLGKPLIKFYVNGKDLMEGGYGTINNSLPKDAVQKVEVLQNHQPIKILQDKVPSDQSAINIKLKNKVTMTGRAEVGSGFVDPWLWNLKLTPMFFGQKNQWVVNYKTNNMGENVEREGMMLSFGTGWEGVRRNASQNDWLNVENASLPNLPEKRYLMNNVHFLSANLLTTPFKNKEWELKANANYTNNVVSRASYNIVNYFAPINSTVITNTENKFYTDKVKGELVFTKNAKKGFFKNTTTFTQFWNADRADVQRSSILGAQAIESPTSSFQNSLSTILPWKEKMINLKSYINYQKDRQNLDITPASYVNLNLPFPSTADMLRQDFGMTTVEANHSANVSFSYKYWTFTPEVGLNFSSNQINSDLYSRNAGALQSLGNAFQNDIKFTNLLPYASLGLNYKSDNWMLFAGLPFNFKNIKAEDPLRNLNKSAHKVTFEPNAFAQYKFLSFYSINVHANVGHNYGDISNLYAGLLLGSPSSLSAMNPNNPLMETKYQSVGSRLEYRNPLNNIFFNVRYSISKTNRNLISSPFVNNLGYVVTNYIEKDNASNSNSLNAELGKYFPSIKSNASVGYGLSNSDSEMYQNNVLFNNKSVNQNLAFKFNNSYFSWLSVDYNATYNWGKQTSVLTNRSVGYNHNLSAYLYPMENHSIGFSWDQINSGTPDLMYHNAFYDLSYQFTWASKKIDFELKWMNIADKKVFERYSVGATSDSYTRMQLRPSQVMLTVKFNFK